MSGKKGGEKRVVVFFGMVASGKSTLAKLWAQRHRYPYANTDVLRKGLALPAGSCRGDGGGKVLYSPAHSRRTYQALLEFAAKALRKADTVVLDGSYQLRAERELLCARLGGQARVLFVLCSCSEEEVKVRLAARSLDPTAVSDGSWEVYLRQQKVFEFPGELAERGVLQVMTEKAPEQLADELDLLLAPTEPTKAVDED
jgi:predicted kinase